MLGVVSGLIGVLACGWWVRQTIAGHVDQDRASWLVFIVAYGVLFAASMAQGARATLWLNGVEFASTALIAVLSWRYGSWSYGRRKSVILLSCDAAAIAGWFLTRDAAVAMVLMLGVIASGAVPTVWKAYRAPRSEPAFSWLLMVLAGIVSVLALGGHAPVIMYGYPAVLIAMSAGVLGAAAVGTVRRPAPRHAGGRRAPRRVLTGDPLPRGW